MSPNGGGAEMALRGSQAQILRAIDESPKDSAGYVSDEQIARSTKIELSDVHDWLHTLEDDRLISIGPTSVGLTVYLETWGRIELKKHQERRTNAPGSGPSPVEKGQPKIRPKGLRAFDKEDAGFFLELLPGPYDHDGLPDVISFWKVRIEGNDPDRSFRVGVVYGPSGCGKSSLVKAGLLPRLPDHVLPVHVEATASDTELSLLKGLRRRCPDLPMDLALADSVAALAQDDMLPSGKKLLLVIDQFEQWLLAKRGEGDTGLVKALRHCEEGRVQALVMVRDDFLSAAIQFMEDLGVEFRPSLNARRVDLFGRPHAKKVLSVFGQSYGALGEDLTPEQQAFLNQAVDGLARDGVVIPVRLALFAEMLKGREWTPKTLREIGGAEGVGVAFLEETFSSSYADPRHRTHQEAARSVLKALLPEGGSDIKGPKRSKGELLKVSSYVSGLGKFDELIRILDPELRLITPTASEDSTEAQPTPPHGDRYYQLTHDYLVPSIREWLTRKQRETRRGRAELRLAERSATWNARPENRQLPSVLEWATIRSLTHRKDWTEPQRRMMRHAGFFHRMRVFGLAVLIGLGTWAGIEGYGNLRAVALVEQLKTASTTDVPPIIEQLQSHRRWAAHPLDRVLASTEKLSGPHLRASLAVLALWPRDSKQVLYLRNPHYLINRLLASSPAEFPVIWWILRKHQPSVVEPLRALLEDPKGDPPKRFRAAWALANFEKPSVVQHWDAVAPFLTDRFLSAVIHSPGDYSHLSEVLRPIRQDLVPPLATIFLDTRRTESERNLATALLADYASDNPRVIANLLMDAEPKAYSILFDVAQRQSLQTIPLLQAEIDKKASPEASETNPEQVKDRLSERQARAAVALVRMGKAEEVWPLLRHSADPRLRSFIVNWLHPLGVDPKFIVAGLDGIDTKAVVGLTEGQQRMNAVLFHPETSMRRALILALGPYGTKGLTPAERESLIGRLLDLYLNDPDAGIHGASEWTLRQWGEKEKLGGIDSQLIKLKDRGDRRWFVNGQGQTFAVIEGPVEFDMGSPLMEPDRDTDESLRRVHIPRRFAIASKEVSVEQYQRFVQMKPEFGVPKQALDRFSSDPGGPMIGVSWYIAAAYCNWLSEREGLPKDQWCYLPAEGGSFVQGMAIPADVLRRTGYRLPTEAEWEYSCRSGTITSRYYGLSTALLGTYARYQDNSAEHAWPSGSMLPNDLGLFDILGNIYEWNHERYKEFSNNEIDDLLNQPFLLDASHRLLRGGALNNSPRNVRSADRSGAEPSSRDIINGFRIVKNINFKN